MKIYNKLNKEIYKVICIDDYGNIIKGDFMESPFYKDIIFNYIIIDDYGDLLYIHSNMNYKVNNTYIDIESKISQYNGIIVGYYYPYLNGKKLILKDNLNKHKEDINTFNEFERNCNTCKHLIRVKHDKCSSGQLKGKCNGSKISTFNYPLIIKNDIIHFYPQDYMDMKCWENR